LQLIRRLTILDFANPGLQILDDGTVLPDGR
jgi:hypothetical protein